MGEPIWRLSCHESFGCSSALVHGNDWETTHHAASHCCAWRSESVLRPVMLEQPRPNGARIQGQWSDSLCCGTSLHGTSNSIIAGCVRQAWARNYVVRILARMPLIEHRVHFGPEVSFYGQGPFSPATPTTATAATAEAGVEGSDGPWILGLFLIASTQAHWKAFHAHSANSGGSLARLHVTSRGSLHQAERGGWRILCEPWSRITCEFGE